MNRVVTCPTFDKRYNHKVRKSPEYLVKRVDSAILELRQSNKPEELGRRKKGTFQEAFGYNLPEGSRLLYTVSRSQGLIVVVLLRVCAHKLYYEPITAIEEWMLGRPAASEILRWAETHGQSEQLVQTATG
jgi:hypothetical protein